MRNGTWIAALLTALTACGTAETGDTGSGGTGGGADVGGTGGMAGAGGSVPEVGCALDITWQDGPELPAGRDHHHTFGFETADGAQLFVVGGWNYSSIYSDAWRLSLGGDGSFTDWEAGLGLPLATAGGGTVVVGERVYIAGGQTSGAFLDQVLTASLQPDGQLGAWQATTPIPEGRFHSSLAHHGAQLIVTGGLAQVGFSASDTVFRATLNGDGSVGAWTTQQLATPRSHHVSFVIDDWLYVAGGLEGSPTGQNTILADVSRASIAEDGSLGAWESVGQLPAPLATMAPLVRGRCAYVFGGLQGFSYSATVLVSAIDADGRTGEWVALPSPLPVGRSHMHHTALLGDRVYLGGGSINYQTVTPQIAIGSFVMPGE